MVERDQDEAPKGKQESAQFWQRQLAVAEKHRKDWLDCARKIEKRYKRAEKDGGKAGKRSIRSMNILYSNTETLKSALYARTPKADVRRRILDRDNPQHQAVTRTAAELLERVLDYCADSTDHDRQYRRAVQDHILVGRGVIWYDYEPRIEQVELPPDPMAMYMIGHNGGPQMQEQIVDQTVKERYVYWQDFLHSPAAVWRDVWWCARRHRMTREDLEENGFPDAEKIPLNWSPDVDDRRSQDNEVNDDLKRAEVWEIWDKRKRKRVFVTKGWPKVLREDDDPYGLEGFWPLQEPLYATLGNDDLTPTPDFEQYSDQADDLDETISRISVLTKAMRRRGVYDASVKELRRLARAGDNEFVPVDGAAYAMMAGKGGLPAAFQVEDISQAAALLLQLYDARDRLIQTIYEITGISDIMRGASDSRETATAQQIKSQFGSMRLRDRQREVQRWVRDGYRIKAELIVEHFEPHVLAQMSGMDMQQPGFMEAIQLLREDKARSYSIDIETDSTVFEDAESEKQTRVELLTAMSQFASNWLPMVAQQPAMMGLAGEMLKFGVRGFKAGRQMEDSLEETLQQLQQAMSQPQPDPEAEKLKAEQEMEQQRFQMDMAGKQLDQQGKVIDLQMKREAAGLNLQTKQAETQMNLAADAMQNEMQFATLEAKLAAQREQAELKREQMKSKDD